ncbi:hypothetical protein PR202_gb16827 [Eleusine coracana subsp. coracana]|uniref:Uncharacterized protein n=1 Tax=Eleusine coracana subsp. coracana TaxID=191504 RepID=A0AAV5F224_ELECO|nr:hypothetical protein PR202_gb16827 [Eleusine coracana subsp. coracana]
MIERAGKLKEEARPLFGACNNIVEKMKLVDTIQHLGIDHMFEEEIDFALHEIQENGFIGSSLYEVALQFRLLREHSLWVSPDVFNKFKGEDGMFRNDIANLYMSFRVISYVIPEAILCSGWNEDASNLLPEYLRKFYNRLLSNFKEMEEELPEDAKYRFARTKREFQEVSACQLRAAEYYYGNIKPNFEDQVAMSFRAGGGRFLLVGQTIGRDDITDETFELAFGTTIDVDATIACLKLGRFMNDIAAFKLGTNKTDVESAVEWYFHENKVTSDVALAKIESVVEEQWKIINKARFGNPVLFPVMKLAIKITVGIFFFNQDRCDHFMFNTEHLRETMLNLYINLIPI